jgi:uncharacterized membrane protein YkvA (DUF1232 family)
VKTQVSARRKQNGKDARISQSVGKAAERDVVTLMFASRNSATPISPKLLALATVAYALSPG